MHVQEVHTIKQAAKLPNCRQGKTCRDVQAVERNSSSGKIVWAHGAAVVGHRNLYCKPCPIQGKCQISHVYSATAARGSHQFEHR
jgi:hypothetical protein